MTILQKQIIDLFKQCDDNVREVIIDVIQFELENIHLNEPRYKTPILDILDRVARTMPKENSDEA